MDETRQRLMKCFQIVFPEIPEKQIESASQGNVEAWDSVAAITLVNVIDEEFGVELDLANLPEFDSFSKIRTYLETEAK